MWYRNKIRLSSRNRKTNIQTIKSNCYKSSDTPWSQCVWLVQNRYHGIATKCSFGDKKKQSLTHISFKNSRPGVKKMGVVITDGKSSEPQLTEWEAKLAHDDGIDVFAIGTMYIVFNI